MAHAFAISFAAVLAAGVVWWRLRPAKERRALQARCFAHPANAKVLAGLRAE